jgi:hypothetical protein
VTAIYEVYCAEKCVLFIIAIVFSSIHERILSFSRLSSCIEPDTARSKMAILASAKDGLDLVDESRIVDTHVRSRVALSMRAHAGKLGENHEISLVKVTAAPLQRLYPLQAHYGRQCKEAQAER